MHIGRHCELARKGRKEQALLQRCLMRAPQRALAGIKHARKAAASIAAGALDGNAGCQANWRANEAREALQQRVQGGWGTGRGGEGRCPRGALRSEEEEGSAGQGKVRNVCADGGGGGVARGKLLQGSRVLNVQG
jgi:hypothetical protein